MGMHPARVKRMAQTGEFRDAWLHEVLPMGRKIEHFVKEATWDSGKQRLRIVTPTDDVIYVAPRHIASVRH